MRDQVPDLIKFLGGDPTSAPKLDPMNKALIPYFPQMHRHAKFGEPGIAKRICRVMDRINIAAGKLKGHPVTDRDVTAVKERLGEGASLGELLRIAKSERIRGTEWL